MWATLQLTIKMYHVAHLSFTRHIAIWEIPAMDYELQTVILYLSWTVSNNLKGMYNIQFDAFTAVTFDLEHCNTSFTMHSGIFTAPLLKSRI